MTDLSTLFSYGAKQPTMAQLLMKQSIDTSPTPSWGAALARALQGGLAGFYDKQDTAAEGKNFDAMFGGGGSPAPDASQPPPSPRFNDLAQPGGSVEPPPMARALASGTPSPAPPDMGPAPGVRQGGMTIGNVMSGEVAPDSYHPQDFSLDAQRPPQDKIRMAMASALQGQPMPQSAPPVSPPPQATPMPPPALPTPQPPPQDQQMAQAPMSLTAPGQGQPPAQAAPPNSGQRQAPQIPPDVLARAKTLWMGGDPQGKAAATALLQPYMAPKESYTQSTTPDGTPIQINSLTGERKASPAGPPDIQTYEYYKRSLPQGAQPMDFATWSVAKARAGATSIANNVDLGSSQTYDKQLAEGLGKAHAGLANGVEDAQRRAHDLAAMQGAIDSIQQRGGTTGGLGQQQILDLKKTINAGGATLGMTPFNESDISDKEFLQKFNQQLAGAQAKGAVGSRVTNFELKNYLSSNPGLELSPTSNQRMIGIQSQIEQRNIAVGNAIRDATAQAISKGGKIDPVTVQNLITQYDDQHHISDPVTGQDLTQSYALPEFQKQGMGTNPGLAVGHEKNINGIKVRRIN